MTPDTGMVMKEKAVLFSKALAQLPVRPMGFDNLGFFYYFILRMYLGSSFYIKVVIPY